MPTSKPSEHQNEILDQFTRQATPFATAPGIRDEAALRLIVECSGAGPEDTVLDVACGPGLVVAAFARVVRHATGIDITPAMLDRARAHSTQLGLTGRVAPGRRAPLPWPDASFSIVTSFRVPSLSPARGLREMKRVTPGGSWSSQAPEAKRADAFNDGAAARSLARRSLPVEEHRDLRPGRPARALGDVVSTRGRDGGLDRAVVPASR
jgi:SAM-dependent methyltransferase